MNKQDASRGPFATALTSAPLVLFLSAAAVPLGAIDGPVILRVEGAVKTPLALTADDLAKMPRTTVKREKNGETIEYEGVLLYDILLKAGGVPFGFEMTGRPMASYVLATARDDFQVVFALAEVDPEFAGARILVADKQDGGPLVAFERPLRVIAPQDKQIGARSLWSLAKIEVVRLRP